MRFFGKANKVVSKFPPGPKGLPVLGNLLSMRNAERFFREMAQRYPVGLFSLNLLQQALVVFEPKFVYQVLTEADNYHRPQYAMQVLESLLGKGILTTDGPEWRRQRNILQPRFEKRHIDGMIPEMHAEIVGLFNRWEKNVNGPAFDMRPDMPRLTLGVLGRTMLGTQELSEEASAVAQALGFALVKAFEYFHRPPFWASLPLPGNFAYKRAIGCVDETVSRLTSQRREFLKKYPNAATDARNLLTALIGATSAESGANTITDRELRDHVVTMLLAGHETTSTSLMWLVYILAKYPNVAEELAAERLGLPNRLLTTNDFRSLRYTKAVVSEALRLYPPLPLIARESVAMAELGGYSIPPKTLVIMPLVLIHTHPEYWESPEKFKPERWQTGDKPKSGAYLPFVLGQHRCIGEHFALLEITLFLAEFFRRGWRVRPTAEDVQPTKSSIRRPSGLTLQLVKP